LLGMFRCGENFGGISADIPNRAIYLCDRNAHRLRDVIPD